MTEILISTIVMLLIALYRIANHKCDDVQSTAGRAFQRGIEELDRYYKKQEDKKS